MTPRTSISGLDPAYTASYTRRGNVTRIGRWISGGTTPCSGSNWSCTHPQYDVAGNVVKTVDPRLKQTTFAYNDRYGSPDGNARLNSAPPELSGLTSFAFPTLITNPVGHTTYTQHDYYLGRPVDQENPTGVVSSFSYNEPLDRPTQQIRAASVTADRSQTSFSYDAVPVSPK